MQCPLCRGRVDLLAKTCVCGFNLEANDPAEVIVLASQDLKTARRLLLWGLASTIGTVLLILIIKPKLSWVDWFFYRSAFRRRLRIDPFKALLGVVPMLMLLTAFYGLGRGTWLLGRSRRRLAAASRMQQLPTARVD